MIRDVYLSRIEKIRGIRPKYRIPVFFSAPAIAKHIPSPLPVYKANLHPKLLPEPSFHPRQIFSFFFLPLVKFSKSDAGGIKERAFSRRLASAQTQKSWVPSIYGYRENEREREREEKARRGDDSTEETFSKSRIAIEFRWSRHEAITRTGATLQGKVGIEYVRSGFTILSSDRHDRK